MSKKEKIFPLNTIGGRIQKKRHDLELPYECPKAI